MSPFHCERSERAFAGQRKGALLTAGLLGLVAFSGCRPSPVPPGRRLANVPVLTRGDLAERYLLTGEMEASSSENLVVPHTNQFILSIRWLAPDGTAVKAGEKVAEFDNSAFSGDLAEKKLAAAQNRSDLAHQVEQNAILAADKQFAVETARIGLAKARLEAGVAPDSYPRRVYQEKQLDLQRAQVALDTANDDLQSQVRSAALEIKVKQIALEKAEREILAAEKAIEELSLKAPRDGVVVVAMNDEEGRKLQIGDGVFRGMAVATLPDVKSMRVKALLSDVDDGRIHEGESALCFLDAYPDLPFRGTVTHISPVAREPTEKSWRRSFQVTVSLEQTDGVKMVPGMSVRVEVEGRKVTGAFIAPLGSIDRGKPSRLRLQEGWVPVEILLCNFQSCAIAIPPEEAGRIQEGSPLGTAGS